MWKNARQAFMQSTLPYARLAHRASIDLRMVRTMYDLLNATTTFRAALEDLFRGARLEDPAVARFIATWKLPPADTPRDLRWSKELHRLGKNQGPRLLPGPRRYPGLEDEEKHDAAAWRRKGYELTPPRLAGFESRRQSAHYLLLRLHGLSYQRIATIANKSVSTVFGATCVWATRLGYPPDRNA